MMVLSAKSNCKLLPVAIMAYNEEKVIQKAVESVLDQESPVGYSIKVVVTPNGCSDRTEEIVRSLERQYPEKVVLLSIKDKGKTRALNRSINYLNELSQIGLEIPYVVFLDADCEFNGKKTLTNFMEKFEQNPQLCAIGADCLPDVVFNGRRDIVAGIYRSIYKLSRSLKINSISGMCYAIRLDILKIIDFPEVQFAEDMFISSRLDGWFCRDTNIDVIFKTPSDLRSEVMRRTKHEIITQRYQEHYSYLEAQGKRVKLFEKSLKDDYRWRGAPENNIIIPWLRLKGVRSKVLVIAYVLIRLWAKIRAYLFLKKIRKNETLDYWGVVR